MKNRIPFILAFLFTLAINCSPAFAWPSPVLNSPANGVQTFTGLTLDWSSVIGSDQYQIEIDTSVNFNSTVLISVTKNYINSNSNNTDTEHFVDDLFFGFTYHWRVRAYVTGDTSSWTQQTFITRGQLVPLSPASGTIYFAGVILDWQAHTGVDFYDFEADTSMMFNSPLLKSDTKAYIDSNSSNLDTEHFLDDIRFGTVYHWRVRARNAVDTSHGYPVWNIVTLDEVIKTAPSAGSNVWAGVNLDWLAHRGVDFYDVEVDTASTFNSPAYKTATKTYVNSSNNNPDTQHFFDDLFFGTTYYWHVRASNAIDTTTWGVDFDFTTNDFVTLVSPVDGQTNVDPNGSVINWDAHAGVDFYQLQLDTTTAFNSPVLVDLQKNYINANNNNTDTQHNTGSILSNTTYFWRVRAINAVDTTSWTMWSFTTSTCSSPGPISGTNALCIGSDTTYNVTPVAGATSYNWTLPSGWTGTSTTNSITVNVGNAGGTISVTVNNSCGISPPQSLFVTVDSLIGPITTLTGPSSVCEGNLTSYFIPSVQGATGYIWTTPSGWTGTSNNNNLLTTPGPIGGDVSVYAVNSCDTTAIELITVTSTPLPLQPGIITGDTLTCIGNNNSYSIAPVAGAVSYIWSLPSGWSGSSTTTSINAITNNASGTISVSSLNSCGTSSPQTLNVIVGIVDTSLQVSGVTITSNATGATYQWLDCNTNQIIVGETSASFTPTVNGVYAVALFQNGCADTSSCVNITSVGINENNGQSFNLYPNPSNGNFIIEIVSFNTVLKFTDLTGRIIKQTNMLRSGKHEFTLPQGMYVVTIQNNTSISSAPLIIQK